MTRIDFLVMKAVLKAMRTADKDLDVGKEGCLTTANTARYVEITRAGRLALEECSRHSKETMAEGDDQAAHLLNQRDPRVALLGLQSSRILKGFIDNNEEDVWQNLETVGGSRFVGQ
ncbi:hypothetical protein MCOR27_004504 [Pyricularia oryzae]|uniref:Uncharacterized protein n=2 Tax=Pyricularia TaxID=48558 RepID=A0ABQ8NK82_PYRGI|nr:hypothetical protein MCOR01_002804 [Pyricularia oryzae]KAI6297079.1 hypothetical protein MCOR33_006465 [Pyricularia grisea]KAI6262734.1 hypothetical protein MCOR19_001074 [Pyricularia oryzae]KAI6280720.1 hypothetical protein MCOR27_004504 [Pyricularia oryzae]KAI6282213.1 hypothetical protein MCOR26_002982 [Pyricularia oryzae]